MNNGQWCFWIDRGGTFTDVVAKNPENNFIIKKYLSVNESLYSDASSYAISKILNENKDLNKNINEIKMGTTVATNALLERKGSKTLLLITKGFKDALEIGYQDRTNIFEKKPSKFENLYQKVLEIDERIDFRGNILKKINLNEIKNILTNYKLKNFKSLAVVLMHGYKYNKHEKLIEKIALKIGFEQVSISSKTSPLPKLVSRGDTTVAGCDQGTTRSAARVSCMRVPPFANHDLM